MKTVLVTGGAGFIGSCYVLSRRTAGERVVNLDKLTYSGNIGNLASLDGDAEHIFVRGDIGDALLVRQLLHHYQPDAVINFAAESHVDRSIHDPDAFVRTNVLGTCTLLRGVLEWWKGLSEERRNAFRFLHVSTDEVYGTLRRARLHGDHPVCAEQPLFGIQGVQRSFREGLSRNLWAPHAHHELLQ
jgi:dTDP-glucose 4,6-dehydratase